MQKLFNKNYILILQGNAVSAIGDLLYSVAIGYWVYEKTGSSALMGLMSSISMFVVMFLSPFSGSVIDKCNRKLIIVGMDVLRGILMLLIGAMAFAQRLSVPAVLITAFLASLCSVFFTPTIHTALLDIIPKDDMVRGQSIHSGVTTLVNLVGKAFSGALVVFLGVPLIIVINGVSYLLSAVTELFIQLPKTVGQSQPVTWRSVLGSMGIALRIIASDSFLRLFIPGVILLNLLAAGPMSLMLPFVMDKGFSVEQYGYLMSVETVASLICVAALSVCKLSPKVRYAAMTAGFALSFLFYCLGFLTQNYIAMCAAMFLGRMGNALGNAVFNASLMLALPQENRGALLGLLSSATTGGSALSVVIYGFLCEQFPIALVFMLGMLAAAFPTLYLCLRKEMRAFVLSN